MRQDEAREQGGGRMALATAAEGFLKAVADTKAADPAELRAAEALFLSAARLPLLPVLAEIHGDERPLPRHSAGVAVTAAALALRLSPESDLPARAFIAGLLHDVGKLAIPEAILAKPGRLDAAETELMKAHVSLGHSLLVRCRGIPVEAAEAALRHHEYLDGSGYPDGVAGAALSPVVRVVTVADIFSALTEPRSYRLAQSAEDAVTILRGMGDKVDQGIVDVLRDVLSYPPTSAAAGPPM